MRRFYVTLIFVFVLLPLSAFAKPRPGFHEGPYLLASGGVLQYDWDQNQLVGIQQGNTFEPTVGFQFGWDLIDWFGLEVKTRYSTNSNQERREHIVTNNLGFTLTLLTAPLLDFKEWRFLPFVRPSLAIAIANLPADPAGNPNRVSTLAVGPSIAGGIHAMYKYLYCGLELQEDFIPQPTKIQKSTGNIIYRGGWKDQFGAMVVVGVHY